MTDTPKLEVETWTKQELLNSLAAESLESRRRLRFHLEPHSSFQQKCAMILGKWLRCSSSMYPVVPKAISNCTSPTGHSLRKEID